MAALTGFLGGFTPETLIKRALKGRMESFPPPARILCLGKAAPSLARGASSLWPGLPGLLYGTAPQGPRPQNFQTLFGDHPFPTCANVERTRRVLRWLDETGGPLLALISGGTSSLLVSPRSPWMLDEKVELTGALWRAGAAISDLNAVRARISNVKAGGLLDAVRPFPCATAVWSDVGPGQFRIVGSGSTIPWKSSVSAEQVLAKYALSPPRPLPPPRERRPAAEGDRHFLLFDAVALRRETAAFLKSSGYAVREVPEPEGISAEDLARRVAGLFVGSRARSPRALLGAGEALVEARGGGRGGRCSHLAALVARELLLSGTPRRWAFAALATDGADGSAGGGAWSDWADVPPEARLSSAIEERSTGDLWEANGTLVPRKPTGNNLRDLWALVEC